MLTGVPHEMGILGMKIFTFWPNAILKTRICRSSDSTYRQIRASLLNLFKKCIFKFLQNEAAVFSVKYGVSPYFTVYINYYELGNF
jgi:hypothetical protein